MCCVTDGVFFTYSVLDLFEIKHKSPFCFYPRSEGNVPAEYNTQVAHNEPCEKLLLVSEIFLNGPRDADRRRHSALSPSKRAGLEPSAPSLRRCQSSSLSTHPSGRSERALEELPGDRGGRNTPAVNLNGAALQESRTLLLYLASP